MEVVTFPDVEALVVSFLNAHLTGAKAATRVPNPRPVRWVRIELASGQERNRVVAEPLFIVQGSAPTAPEAFALCERARALLRAMPEDPGQEHVAGCTSSSLPVPFPDPDVPGTPRYQSTVQLLVCP